MTDNPIAKVIDRLASMAMLRGTAYCRVNYDADTEMFNFTPLLPEHVKVDYSEKKDD